MEEPEWIHLSELYQAEKNNLLEICLEKKFNTEEKVNQKWEALRPIISKKRRHERLVYSTLNMVTPLCAFLEDVPASQTLPRRPLYMDRGYQWIQRIRFQNNKAHVEGVCDGLMATSLVRRLDGVPQKQVEAMEADTQGMSGVPYLITLIKPSLERNPAQHELEMTALLRFFRNGDARISDKWVLVMGKNQKVFLHSFRQQEKKLLQHLRRIHKVKRWSGLMDLEDDLPLDWQPNMKLLQGVWTREKEELARRTGDITLLWCCDDRHRQIAWDQQVFSWKDERFTPELVGFTDPEKIETLRRIVEVNRSLSEWLYVDASLSSRFPEMVVNGDTRHLFVDFEYLANDFIYLVGVWDVSNQQYTAFWAKDLSERGLACMWASFQRFLNSFPGGYRCWYWYAEVKMMEKTQAPLSNREKWTDLWEVCRAGVAVRGAFQFGLKNFVKAFHEHGKMPLQYGDLECQDGLSSITMAESYYQTRDLGLQQNLERYNRYDCEAMGYIWEEVRQKLL